MEGGSRVRISPQPRKEGKGSRSPVVSPAASCFVVVLLPNLEREACQTADKNFEKGPKPALNASRIIIRLGPRSVEGRGWWTMEGEDGLDGSPYHY